MRSDKVAALKSPALHAMPVEPSAIEPFISATCTNRTKPGQAEGLGWSIPETPPAHSDEPIAEAEDHIKRR